MKLAGAASRQRKCRPVPAPDYLFADTVGTGGDGSNSINISTASALVAAACGLKVANTANCSVQQIGSSDLLAAFGSINSMRTPHKSRQALDELGSFPVRAEHHTDSVTRCRFANS